MKQFTKTITAILLAMVIFSNISAFAFTNITTFDSYNDVLDYWLEMSGTNGDYTYYTMCDIDGNGSDELIVGFGGSDGFDIYGYYNNQVIDYESYINNIVGLYMYNNTLYEVQGTLCNVNSEQVTFEISLIKITLLNNKINKEVLYNTNYTRNINDDTDYSVIPEVSTVVSNGTEIEFLSINDRSLLNKSEISVYVNGTKVTFDQQPFIQNGRTLVPVRAIFEALGASVEWNSPIVTAKKGETIVFFGVGSQYNHYNKNYMRIYDGWDVPAQIINDRVFVPLRAVSEAFDCEVSWDGNTRTVNIWG